MQETTPGVLAQIDIAGEVAKYHRKQRTTGGVPCGSLACAEGFEQAPQPEISLAPQPWPTVRETPGVVVKGFSDEGLQQWPLLIEAELHWAPDARIHFDENIPIGGSDHLNHSEPVEARIAQGA